MAEVAASEHAESGRANDTGGGVVDARCTDGTCADNLLRRFLLRETADDPSDRPCDAVANHAGEKGHDRDTAVTFVAEGEQDAENRADNCPSQAEDVNDFRNAEKAGFDIHTLTCWLEGLGFRRLNGQRFQSKPTPQFECRFACPDRGPEDDQRQENV